MNPLSSIWWVISLALPYSELMFAAGVVVSVLLAIWYIKEVRS